MPDDNRFFRYVWRFNAVVLALAAVVVVVGIGWNLLSFWVMGPSVAPPEGHFAPVPKAAEREFTYRLEANPSISELGGEKIFTLKRWRGEPNVYGLADSGPRFASSSPDSGVRDVNLMAIDARNASSHWLFRGYQRSLLSVDAVYAGKGDGVPAPMSAVTTPAVAVVIQLVAADTNGDGELDQKDRQSLYVYRAGDAGAVKLLDADFFLATGQIDAAKYLIVYEQGATATAAIYSIPEFKLLSQARLPNVPQ
jgi:hypothetical protein